MSGCYERDYANHGRYRGGSGTRQRGVRAGYGEFGAGPVWRRNPRLPSNHQRERSRDGASIGSDHGRRRWWSLACHAVTRLRSWHDHLDQHPVRSFLLVFDSLLRVSRRDAVSLYQWRDTYEDGGHGKRYGVLLRGWDRQANDGLQLGQYIHLHELREQPAECGDGVPGNQLSAVLLHGFGRRVLLYILHRSARDSGIHSGSEWAGNLHRTERFREA